MEGAYPALLRLCRSAGAHSFRRSAVHIAEPGSNLRSPDDRSLLASRLPDQLSAMPIAARCSALEHFERRPPFPRRDPFEIGSVVARPPRRYAGRCRDLRMRFGLAAFDHQIRRALCTIPSGVPARRRTRPTQPRTGRRFSEDPARRQSRRPAASFMRSIVGKPHRRPAPDWQWHGTGRSVTAARTPGRRGGHVLPHHNASPRLVDRPPS